MKPAPEKKVKLSLGWKMIIMSEIPIFVLVVSIVVYSAFILRDGMRTEAMDGLRYLANSIRAAYAQIDEGDYFLNDSGELMKGELNVSARTDIIDSFVADTDADATIFFGDVRMATTLVSHENGERIVGTSADADIAAAVLQLGNNYESYHLYLNGERYYAYYEPMKNNDGTIVGMVFVGMPMQDINDYITLELIKIGAWALIITLIAILVISVFCIRLGKAMRQMERTIETIADGDLTVQISEKLEKRVDEVGVIMYVLRKLTGRLSGVVTDIRSSADKVYNHGSSLESTAAQTSSTADEISGAVEGISKGAVSQAEDIEEATCAVSDIGREIENIVAKVEELNKTAEQMREAGDEAAEIMVELSASNDKATNAIARVAQTVKQTDTSVQQIREAVAMITSIASETSLLSLNASIEAARAGEAGKGFAVVASEIQKLAEESNQSAQRIEEIINNLLQDSQRTISVMNEVNVTVDDQQKKLQETKEKFANVSKGIASSRENIEQVSNEAEKCDRQRVQVVDLLQNLSAISEENAAATEETTASMQELNATINLLAQSSEELLRMSQELNQEIEYFKVN